MQGAKLKKRIRTAVFKEDEGKEAEVDMTVTETSAPSITSTEARRRLAMKAGLDMDNRYGFLPTSDTRARAR